MHNAPVLGVVLKTIMRVSGLNLVEPRSMPAPSEILLHEKTEEVQRGK